MPRNSISLPGAVGPLGESISMGGMFTILKVCDPLNSYDEDPGWYKHPFGTVATNASESSLAGMGLT